MRISVNDNARVIVEDILDDYERLNCSVVEHKNGATVIDAGVGVTGCYEHNSL